MPNLLSDIPRLTSPVARRLDAAMSRLPVIDSHEHLFPESERLACRPDAVSMFEQYPRLALCAAGMSVETMEQMTDRDRPLDRRWAMLKPYLPKIRHTSLVRALMIGMRQLYGIEDVTDANYVEITETLVRENQPGIYRRVFRDHCRVVAALNQQMNSKSPPWEMPEPGSFRLTQMWESHFNFAWRPEPLDLITQCTGRNVSNLAEYIEGLGETMAHYRDRGVLGIKLLKEAITTDPDSSDAAPLFDRLLQCGADREPGKAPLSNAEHQVLRDYIAHAVLRNAGRLGLRVLFHCGTKGPGNDFRPTDPLLLVPLFQKYSDVIFELYHAGLPHVRATGVIAQSFANVYINMCWAHSMTPRIARRALDEWLDFVPLNKLIAFGADTTIWIEHAIGDLIMTRQNLATVLAGRVETGEMTEDQALEAARMMLYDNPIELYDLKCRELDDLKYV